MANADSGCSLKSYSRNLEAIFSHSQMIDLTAGQLSIIKYVRTFLDLESTSDNTLLRIF